jgi:photosystem II stability/assembly factor-like uncharacterized protein
LIGIVLRKETNAMNHFLSRKLWMTSLAILMLSLLSACGALSIQFVTPTNVPVTPPADTSTPETLAPTQTQAPTEMPTASATSTTQPPSGATVIGAVTIEYIKMSDADKGWAIGKLIGGTSDMVLDTQDGGKTWKNITPAHAFDTIGPDNKSAIASFIEPGNAWVLFYNKDLTPPGSSSVVVWSTKDGGQTWQSSQALDIANIQMAFFKPSDISFADPAHGWILAHLDAGMMHDYVTVFATTDGGMTWKEVVDPTGQSLYQSCYKSGMVFLDASTGWIAGDCGGVQAGVYFYQTKDSGKSWTLQALPAPAATPNAFTDQNNACSAYPPQFINANTGFMSVKCTNLSKSTPVTTTWPYITSDGGTTWKALENLAEPVGSLYFFDEQTGWYLGASSIDASTASHSIYQTTDGGKTWTKLALLSWSGQMDFISPQAGWVVATDGSNLALVKTTNGGSTWVEIKPEVVSN